MFLVHLYSEYPPLLPLIPSPTSTTSNSIELFQAFLIDQASHSSDYETLISIKKKIWEDLNGMPAEEEEVQKFVIKEESVEVKFEDQAISECSRSLCLLGRNLILLL